MSCQKRFEIIKNLIDKTFPDVEPDYNFNPLSKHYEVYYNHPNGACFLSILEDSKRIDIKKKLKNKLHLLN